MRSTFLAAFCTALILALAGCGSRTRNVTGPRADPITHAYVGTLSGSPPIDVVLQIQVDYKNDVSGEYLSGANGITHASVSGTRAGDSLHLRIGPASFAGRMTDSLVGVWDDGGSAARLTARGIGSPALGITSTTLYPLTAIGAAQAGDVLWLATSEPAFARARDDALFDVVRVDSPPGVSWSSSAIVWDGTRLWGERDAVDGGADLLGFDDNGRTDDSIHVSCRPLALAYYDGSLWALRQEPPALLRLDAQGGTIESLHVEVPDARCMTWYGGSFWVMGATLPRLYSIRGDGTVSGIARLPSNGAPSPVALTSGGGRGLEYVESLSGTTWVHRMQQVVIP